MSRYCKRGHLVEGPNLRLKIRHRKKADGTPVDYIEHECVECHRVQGLMSKYRDHYAGRKVNLRFNDFRPKISTSLQKGNNQ